MSYSARNVEGGTLLDFLTYTLLQNIKKNPKGGPFGDIKNFRKKVTQCRKKSKGGTL